MITIYIIIIISITGTSAIGTSRGRQGGGEVWPTTRANWANES